MSTDLIVDIETWRQHKLDKLLWTYCKPFLVEDVGKLFLYLINPEIVRHISPLYWNQFISLCDTFTESWLNQTGISAAIEHKFVGRQLTDELVEEVMHCVVQRLCEFEKELGTTYVDCLKSFILQEIRGFELSRLLKLI